MNISKRDFVRCAIATAGAWLPAHRLWAAAADAGAAPADIVVRTLSGRSASLRGADIRDFHASLRGQLLLPASEGYDAARKLWNAAIDHHPALIARCTGAADVIRAVQFARTHELLTAVRGGGHSISGQSGCDGGLMIDLSPMKGIRVDAEHRTAQAQPGVLLGELDQETQAFGLATTLGTAAETGIAGLTLGGGVGRLARKFGLSCDNLRSVDIVTAAGKLLQASEDENADLFWGVRGGGGNFGIVTNFEYRLHPVGPLVLAGSRAYPLSQASTVLAAVAEISEQAPDELYLSFALGPRPNGGWCAFEAVYCGNPGDGERLLAPLAKLGKPVLDSVTTKTYLEAQGIGIDDTGGYVPGRSYYLKSGFIGTVSTAVIKEVMDCAGPAAPPILDTLGFVHLGGAIARVEPTATAYWNRGASHDLALVASWEGRAQNDQNVKTARTVWAQLEPFTRGYYINTDTPDDERRLRATFGDNYPRLVQLKNKYDPTNLFRLNANIRPTVGS